jgi:hypothetical protein
MTSHFAVSQMIINIIEYSINFESQVRNREVKRKPASLSSFTMADNNGLPEYLEQQFEAHQQDEGAFNHAAAARAASMKKQIHLFALNDGVSKLSLERSDQPEEEAVIASFLLQYVDAAIAVEISNETREPVERVLDLASALGVMLGETSTQAVTARAIEFSTALLERVRAQACQLMGLLALHMSDREEEWAKECFEALTASILSRLTDKSQSVRNSAIRASKQLLASSDDMDDLLEIVLWNLWHDPSVVNRVAAVDALPISHDTVDHIITRIRDVKEKVRVQALDVLRNKVDPLSDLTSEHLAEIIRCGLSAR